MLPSTRIQTYSSRVRRGMGGWAFFEDKREVTREKLRAKKRVECQENAGRERGRRENILQG